MFASFTDKPDLTPYIARAGADRPERGQRADGLWRRAGRCKMDFDEYDKIDDFELNEILWRSIKGKDAPVPPAVRRAIAYRGE